MLQYSYVPDILEKRGPYRNDHLEGAKKMVGSDSARVEAEPALDAALWVQASENKLVMAGALTDPIDGALFIFRNTSKEVSSPWSLWSLQWKFGVM